MDEQCGTAQNSVGILRDIGNAEGDDENSDVCGKRYAEIMGSSDGSGVCLPICFLVREQAKSIIAIKELQKRMYQMEGVQGDVISAISDVQDYLTVNSESNILQTPSPRSCSNKSPSSDQKTSYLTSISPLRAKTANNTSPYNISTLPSEPQDKKWCQNVAGDHLMNRAMGSIRQKDSAPESDKQDSGLDSDCREPGQESNPLHSDMPCVYNVCPPVVARMSSDELSDLLDEIGEKSEILRQHAGFDQNDNHSTSQLIAEKSNLQLDRLELHNLMSDIKDERNDLKIKLENLESSTSELKEEKKDLEQRFITALVEKHKLETKIHGLKTFSMKSDTSQGSWDSKKLETTYEKLSKAPIYKVNSEAVSAVLKETNIVDLQKQVLSYMMENEVLRMKMDQVEQLLESKDMEKICLEKLFREEVRQLMFENEQLRIQHEEQKTEMGTQLSRVRMLERIIESMTVENQELNHQLAESVYLKEKIEKNRRFCTQRYSPSHQKRMSLPGRHATEPEISVRCAKSKLLPNTSSFINVTIEDPEISDVDLASTLDAFGISQRKSSTPLNPNKKMYELPSTSSLGVSSSGHRVMCERQPNRRLTFNSMKPFASSSTTNSSGQRHKNPPRSNHCDTAASSNKPLESIKETMVDSKQFPFYTILEKLKESSNYKLSPQIPEPRHQDTGSDTTSKADHSEASAQTQEGCATLTKDKRSGASKNIHRRIQNILDRITAESDVVLPV